MRTAAVLAGLIACLAGPLPVNASESRASAPRLGDSQRAGTVRAPEINEISGLTASARRDVYWLHNDSGDTPRLFAVSTGGRVVAELSLTGALAFDWEDLASGPGPEAAKRYLYIADIGDNRRVREEVVVHRVVEPPLPASSHTTESADETGPLQLEAAPESFAMRYPDGAHDAEVLLVDPTNGRMFILTKSFETQQTHVFAYPGELDASMTKTLERVGYLELPGRRAPDSVATAGEISPDGRIIMLRSYSTAWLWRHSAGTRVEHTLMTVGSKTGIRGRGLPFDQYEAAAFDPSSARVVTISEGTNVSFFLADVLVEPGK